MTEQTETWYAPERTKVTIEERIQLLNTIIISGASPEDWMQLLQNAVYALKGVKG